MKKIKPNNSGFQSVHHYQALQLIGIGYASVAISLSRKKYYREKSSICILHATKKKQSEDND